MRQEIKSSFDKARKRLDQHDLAVTFWREMVRPRCENHRQMGFWERNRHVWRGDDMCPYCRGKFTSTGYPAYSGNMLSDVLAVEYGPGITKMLNEPTVFARLFPEPAHDDDYIVKAPEGMPYDEQVAQGFHDGDYVVLALEVV